MPTKPFYSMDEVCQKLGKTQDEIKALVRDGALREFRDAGKIFFKAEDIDKLAGVQPGASEPAQEEEILLEPAGEAVPDDGLASLTDSSGGTSIIGLEPLGDEEGEKKEDTVVTASGIGVFDEDELEVDTDPMAKTQITSVAATDQVSLEGAGSGSGLLDLAREADDTALGADLLDEIYPGEEEAVEAEVKPAAAQPPAPAAAAEAMEKAALEGAEAGEPVTAGVSAAADATEGMFSGLLVASVVLMALASTVVAGLVRGYLPDYGRFLGDGARFYFLLGGSVALAGMALAAGWFIARAFLPRGR